MHMHTQVGYRTDGSSAGTDYGNDEAKCWLIRPKAADASKVVLSFQRFDTEAGYDRLRVYDGGHVFSPEAAALDGSSFKYTYTYAYAYAYTCSRRKRYAAEGRITLGQSAGAHIRQSSSLSMT